mmetsp:Transcript_54128/g.143724  ORF Transcript_54128/g.143724 Transcript_54128/m.143724 type:complete len:438 (+) Transcript_54128:430-1743(+)
MSQSSNSLGVGRQSYYSGRTSSHRRSMASVQMMKVWEMLPAPARSEWAHTVWKVLDDSESSLLAKVYEQVMQCFILISMVTCMLHSLEEQPLQGLTGVVVETCIDILFVAEVMLRFTVCPNRTMFFFSVFNYIDIASTIPLLLRCVMGFAPAQVEECVGSEIHPASCVHTMLIAIVPFLRLAKMLRRFLTLHLLLKAFRSALEALPVLIFIYCLILLGFSGLLFVVENRSNLHTYYYSMWLTIVSMTTLGYGDVTPKTDQGRLVIGCCVLCTMFYTAIPLGIIGNAFNDVWKNRDRILLMQRARNGMKQAGYTAKDVGKLFRIFDKDRDGLLNLKEFSWMVEGMRLGLTRERVYELYELFDDDDSGGIDEREFVRGLFPERYHELYGNMDANERPTDRDLKRNHDTLMSESGNEPGLVRSASGTAARLGRSTLRPGR